MELESNKYKKRLTIIVVLLIISVILAIIVERQLKKEAETVDGIVETIQGTTEEEYNETMKKRQESGKNVPDYYKTKEQALTTMQAVQERYNQIYTKYNKLTIILVESFALLGSMVAVMMYSIFSGWVIQKVIPNIKKWLSIIIRIAIVIIMLPIPTISILLILIGVFGQLPFMAYTLYKYIKIKKTEDKDDIIEEK